MMKKNFKLPLPFQKTHIKYIESSETELEELDLLFLLALYKNKDNLEEKLIETIRKELGLNKKFNEFIIEKIKNLVNEEYFKITDASVDDYSKLFIGNVKLHELILNKFDNNNPTGIKKEQKQKEIIFIKSFIDEILDSNNKEKDIFIENAKNQITKDEIRKNFPLNPNEKILLDYKGEIIANFLEKNKDLFFSEILASDFCLLDDKEIEFEFRAVDQKTIEILSKNKVENAILEKIEKEKKFDYLKRYIVEKSFNEFDDSLFKNVTKLKNKHIEEIDKILVLYEKYDEATQQINLSQKIEKLESKNLFYWNEKIYEICQINIDLKTIGNYLISSDIPLFYARELSTIEREKIYQEIVEKTVNDILSNETNEYDDIQELNDLVIENRIINKLYEKVKEQKLAQFLKILDFLLEHNKYNSDKFFQNTNYEFFISNINSYQINEYTELWDLYKNIIEDQFDNEKIKKYVFEKIEDFEKNSPKCFEWIIKKYNINPEFEENYHFIKNTNLYKKFKNIEQDIKDDINLIEKIDGDEENIDLDSFDKKISDYSIDIGKNLMGFEISKFNQMKKSLETLKNKNVSWLAELYKKTINTSWEEIEANMVKMFGKIKDKNFYEKYIEKILEITKEKEHRKPLLELKKIRNEWTHESIMKKQQFCLFDLKKAQDNYRELNYLVKKCKDIIEECKNKKANMKG